MLTANVDLIYVGGYAVGGRQHHPANARFGLLALLVGGRCASGRTVLVTSQARPAKARLCHLCARCAKIESAQALDAFGG